MVIMGWSSTLLSLRNWMRARLQGKLSDSECVEVSVSTVYDPSYPYNMWDMYCRYWQPFGELLTDMEREGMQVNRCSMLFSALVSTQLAVLVSAVVGASMFCSH